MKYRAKGGGDVKRPPPSIPPSPATAAAAARQAVEEMETLCSDFAAMHRATLAYKPTRNVKGVIVDANGNPLETSAQHVLDTELEECTFGESARWDFKAYPWPRPSLPASLR